LGSKDRHPIPYAYFELISKIAPNLFKQARFKKRMVATELQDNNWIKNLGEINSTSALEEYILLYFALSTMLSLIRETKLSGVGHLMANTRQNLHTIVSFLEP
jgi:hypothetical protein